MLAILLLPVPSLSLSATIYKCTSENGKVSYSDRECPGATVVIAPSESRSSSSSNPSRSAGSKQDKAYERFLDKAKLLERDKCNSGDADACESLKCLDMNMESASKADIAKCEALGERAKWQRNKEAARKVAAGEQYVNPYWGVMIEANREILAEECKSGIKRSCTELEATPKSMRDANEQFTRKAKAACEAGTGTADICEGVYCHADEFTSQCRYMMEKMGRAVGKNWYQSQTSRMGNSVTVVIKCYDKSKLSMWPPVLDCTANKNELACEVRTRDASQPPRGPNDPPPILTSLSIAAGRACSN